MTGTTDLWPSQSKSTAVATARLNLLALALDVPLNRITSIIHGDRGISAETAVLFAHAFTTSPEFWLNLQGALRPRCGGDDGAGGAYSTADTRWRDSFTRPRNRRVPCLNGA
jgi:hypothetical protein